jgi:hypothetical protein
MLPRACCLPTSPRHEASSPELPAPWQSALPELHCQCSGSARTFIAACCVLSMWPAAARPYGARHVNLLLADALRTKGTVHRTAEAVRVRSRKPLSHVSSSAGLTNGIMWGSMHGALAICSLYCRSMGFMRRRAADCGKSYMEAAALKCPG